MRQLLFGLATILVGCVSSKNFKIQVENVYPLSFSEVIGITGEDYKWTEKYTNGNYFNVVLSIDESFITYNIENIGNVSTKYRFCDLPREDLFLGRSRLYAQGTNLLRLVWEGESQTLFTDGRAQVSLVVFGQWLFDEVKGATNHREYFAEFDQLKRPKDICFFIRSAGILYGVDSEEVIIPKELFR